MFDSFIFGPWLVKIPYFSKLIAWYQITKLRAFLQTMVSSENKRIENALNFWFQILEIIWSLLLQTIFALNFRTDGTPDILRFIIWPHLVNFVRSGHTFTVNNVNFGPDLSQLTEFSHGPLFIKTDRIWSNRMIGY